MSIRFNCPHCNLSLTVADQFSGTKSNCLRCRETVTIPDAFPLPESVPSGLTFSRLQRDYRSIAIRYRYLKIFWLSLWVMFIAPFFVVGALEHGSELAMVIVILVIPLSFLGLLIIGLNLWWKKRILRKGGYSVGFLGVNTDQFKVDCPQCNSAICVSDSICMNPSTCPLCQSTVIPALLSVSRVSSKVLHSEQWKYDYRAIVRWDRRMMLALLLFFTGIAICASILVFLVSMQGNQGLFLHQTCMLLAGIFLLFSVLSFMMYLVSAIKLIGLLHLHLSIILVLVMGISVIGLLLYIPFLLLKIKLRASSILLEGGYTCALWESGMKQFSCRDR